VLTFYSVGKQEWLRKWVTENPSHQLKRSKSKIKLLFIKYLSRQQSVTQWCVQEKQASQERPKRSKASKKQARRERLAVFLNGKVKFGEIRFTLIGKTYAVLIRIIWPTEASYSNSVSL